MKTTPTKSILDPSFRYLPSHATDVRRTFERVREEMKKANTPPAEAMSKVVALEQRKSA